MKNLLKFQAAIILIATITFLSSSNVSAKDKYPLEISLLKNYLVLPTLDEETVFKFYDKNDNLVYKSALKFGDSPDHKLVKYLNESDMLIQTGGIKIHRLKN